MVHEETHGRWERGVVRSNEPPWDRVPMEQKKPRGWGPLSSGKSNEKREVQQFLLADERLYAEGGKNLKGGGTGQNNITILHRVDLGFVPAKEFGGNKKSKTRPSAFWETLKKRTCGRGCRVEKKRKNKRHNAEE